jgi:hypothetical protein
MYWLSIDRVRERLDVSMAEIDQAVAYALKARLVLASSKIEPHSITVTPEGWMLSAASPKAARKPRKKR